MELLKKENWWVWLLLTLFSGGSSYICLGALLNVFDKKAWYAKPKNWLIGVLCLFFPAAIMVMVFTIQITCQTAAKLNVKGSEYYLSVYVWLLLMIIPVIGWTILVILALYLTIWTLVALYQGNGEKYLEEVK